MLVVIIMTGTVVTVVVTASVVGKGRVIMGVVQMGGISRQAKGRKNVKG